MVQCLECGIWYMSITNSHLKICCSKSTSDYRKDHPGASMIDDEVRIKLSIASSESSKDRVVSDEAKRNMSIAKTSYYKTEEGLNTIESIRETLTGRTNGSPSEETRSKISEGLLNWYRNNEVSDETRQRLSNSIQAFWDSDESSLARQKVSEASTGRIISEETRLRMSIVQIGHIVTEDTKRKISIGNKAYYSSTEGLLCLARLLSERTSTKPDLAPYLSKGEKYLHILLEEVFPGQYEYTGNGSFHIGTKIPDFKHVTKMKVVEFYGSSSEQYHGHILGEEEERSKEFAKYGYEVLFIRSWEIDLKERDFEKVATLLNRIKKFTYS